MADITNPLIKTLGEMYRHYAPYIDSFIESKRREQNERQLVGETDSMTLRRVYGREGYLQALTDILEGFREST